MRYSKPLTVTESYRLSRIRYWKEGHTFEELDSISMEDWGDIIGYDSEYNKAEEQLRARESALKKHR